MNCVKKTTISLLEHQGFCFGVLRSIKIANSINNNHSVKKPIYLLGPLVHNEHVNNYFSDLGYKLVNYDDIINIKNGTLIIPAHGASSEILRIALQNELSIVDATCPKVKSAYLQIKEDIDNGFDVLFYGQKLHPEALSISNLGSRVHIIESIEDISALDIKNESLILTSQTTMSYQTLYELYTKLLDTYPHLLLKKQVCSETTLRQNEVIGIIKKSNNNQKYAFIIVGDKSSNNCNQLVKTIVSISKASVYLINNIDEISHIPISLFDVIYLGSGTSTPNALLNAIYQELKKAL